MKENHDTLTRFEDSMIYKIFTFNFFNIFNSYFVIGFLKYTAFKTNNNLLIGPCANTELEMRRNMRCLEELQGQTWSFFILSFVFNFVDILWPLLKNCCKKKFHGIPRKYSWGKIDNLIENEYYRKPYQATQELDAVIYDYTEIVIQFASLSFFGMIFPLAFLLSFLTSIFEIHLDKYYFMKYIRRPIPRSTSDIGSWEAILNAISYFTIFINAGLIVFTCEGFQEINYLIFQKDRTKDIL